MAQSSTGRKNGSDRAYDSLVPLIKGTGKLLKIFWMGLVRLPYRSLVFQIYFWSGAAAVGMLSYRYYHLKTLHFLFPMEWTRFVIELLAYPGPQVQATVMVLLYGYAVIFGFGIKPFKLFQSCQRAIDLIAPSNRLGVRPKVKEVTHPAPYKTKITVFSEGMGVDRYEARKDDLTSSFGQIVESVKYTGNPKFIEINLSKKALPKLVYYNDLVKKLAQPYSFMVGESLAGAVSCQIRDLPHMLVAGATGGGKSVWLNNLLLCLHRGALSLPGEYSGLQMYLIDLKGGVEMKPYSELPNVRVLKTEKEAVIVLRQLKSKMQERIAYLEENGYKKIEPERDKKDIIVIGVDEASVLYTLSKRKSEKNDLIHQARELTDDLAKLSRAAGMHLVLATQKAVKESVDTRVLENLSGRMIFRMNGLQGSLTALGNKMAMELPDVPGRGIWSVGSDFTEVQAPFISEEDISAEIKDIKAIYDETGKKTFEPPIQLNNGGSTKGKLNKKIKEGPSDETSEDA